MRILFLWGKILMVKGGTFDHTIVSDLRRVDFIRMEGVNARWIICKYNFEYLELIQLLLLVLIHSRNVAAISTCTMSICIRKMSLCKIMYVFLKGRHQTLHIYFIFLSPFLAILTPFNTKNFSFNFL